MVGVAGWRKQPAKGRKARPEVRSEHGVFYVRHEGVAVSPSFSVRTESLNLRIETVPPSGAFDPGDLSGEERARVLTFASSERRRQFVLGRLAVRRLVGETQGVAPAAVELGIDASGAPRVATGYVSIAHGGHGFGAIGLAAYARQPVGVDAESIRPRHPGLGARILRDDEADAVRQLDAAPDAALTLVWALKESVLKGQGTGLRAGARSVRIDELVPADGRARLVSDTSGVWHLSFERRGDLWLAVALSEPAPSSIPSDELAMSPEQLVARATAGR